MILVFLLFHRWLQLSCSDCENTAWLTTLVLLFDARRQVLSMSMISSVFFFSLLLSKQCPVYFKNHSFLPCLDVVSQTFFWGCNLCPYAICVNHIPCICALTQSFAAFFFKILVKYSRAGFICMLYVSEIMFWNAWTHSKGVNGFHVLFEIVMYALMHRFISFSDI